MIPNLSVPKKDGPIPHRESSPMAFICSVATDCPEKRETKTSPNSAWPPDEMWDPFIKNRKAAIYIIIVDRFLLMSLKKYNGLMQSLTSSSMTGDRIKTFTMALIVLTASVVLVIGIGFGDCDAKAGDVFTVPNEDGIDIEYMIKTDGITVQVGTSTVRDAAVDASVVSVRIPGTVQHNGATYKVVELGSYSFYGCASLTSVTIPDSVTVLSFNAFDGCTSLRSIDIPDGVTSITGSVFSGCTSLTTVDMPKSLTSIGASAFYKCESLRSIDIPDGVATIGSSAFAGCTSLESVSTPSSVVDLYQDAFRGCTSLKSVDISNGLKYITSYVFYGCTSLESVTIPSSVATIGSSAFAGCTSLESVTIPSGVKEIGSSAFDYCTTLRSVTIPSSVTSIGYGPFDYCTSLTQINVDSGNANFVSKDGVLFDSDMTTLIQFPAGRGGSYVIPSGVTVIGEYAFAGSETLESVTIPSSVKEIRNYAFEDCASLTSVAIPSGVTSISWSAFKGVCNGDNAAAGATVGHVFDDEHDADCNNGCGYIRDVAGGDDPGVTPGGDDDTPDVPGGDDGNPDSEPGGEGSGDSALWIAAIVGIIVVIAIVFFVAKNRRIV